MKNKAVFDPAKIKNPVLDKRPHAFIRDPAIIYCDGVFRCFHTTVVKKNNIRRLYLEMSVSENLIEWQTTRLTTSNLNFSSPGNVIWDGQEWCMCVQSYPIDPGDLWGNDKSRLWLIRSHNLIDWSKPEIIVKNGCACRWVDSPRQIDPYLVRYEKEYYCFYKAQGQLGALKSPDLTNWEEASPDKPIISQTDTPGNCAVENPCIVSDDNGRFLMFFSPCCEGRGIGIAQSDNLTKWENFKILNFPELPWAKNGPTAPAVINMRREIGKWLMVFHGEDVSRGHSAAIGVAWSENLIDWQVP